MNSNDQVKMGLNTGGSEVGFSRVFAFLSQKGRAGGQGTSTSSIVSMGYRSQVTLDNRLYYALMYIECDTFDLP